LLDENITKQKLKRHPFSKIMVGLAPDLDGIEPPPPAFSGLLIDNAKWFRI
jgi:hypothetical protein